MTERLTNRERYILLRIYGESRTAREVAAMLRLDPSRVTQLLGQIRRKIRSEAGRMLVEEHSLSREAVDECLAEIVANPEYSLLIFIEQA